MDPRPLNRIAVAVYARSEQPGAFLDSEAGALNHSPIDSV
jgi:hypothetical protein